MDVIKLAADLIPLVGGKENIKSVIHCMTRLRFQLADMSKAQISKIEQLDGVMGVKEVGVQTQVIIGPNVAEVYKEVTRVCFKTIKVTKQGYRQGKQRHENKAPFSHTGLKNDGDF